MKPIRYLLILMDATFIDMWREKSHYPKDPRDMTWGEFWELA